MSYYDTMGSVGSMDTPTQEKEGEKMKLFWQKAAQKKDFDIVVRGGNDEQLYVEIESTRTMEPEALKEFYLAIHNLTGWYPTRDIFPTGKVNGKDRCSMRFDRKKDNCSLF